jgi:hypothetical protein
MLLCAHNNAMLMLDQWLPLLLLLQGDKIKHRPNVLVTTCYLNSVSDSLLLPLLLLLPQGDKITLAADVFAFGLLMYTVFTGQEPYTGMTPADIVSK